MRRIFSITLSILIAFTLIPYIGVYTSIGGDTSSYQSPSIGTYAEAASVDLNVKSPTQEEIVLFAQEHPYFPACFEYSGLPIPGQSHVAKYASAPNLSAPYKAGVLSDDELISALNTIKLIRYVAGISHDIYLSDQYTELAQAAAIVGYANGYISHTPSFPTGMSYNLASQGIEGAKLSNLAFTNWQNNTLTWNIINGWMDDGDASNLPYLGHRRWILNPQMNGTGFGLISGPKGTFSSMYVVDNSNTYASSSGVCWPAQNMPTSLFPKTSPWSISLNKKIDAGDISVFLRRNNDGKLWMFTPNYSDGDFYINNDSFGQPGCIIFRPSDIEAYNPGDNFTVTIVGTGLAIQYDVDFFDLEGFYASSAPTITKAKENSLGKPSLSWTVDKTGCKFDIYRCTKGGSWKLLKKDLKSKSFDDSSAGAGIEYQYKIVSKSEVNDTIYTSPSSEIVTVKTTLNVPKLSSVKATGKKANTIKWTKVSKATGYKVYRRLSGNSKWTLIKTTSSLSYKDTKSTSGKKYQYRVRAYRTLNGNTVYSKYTGYKTVKTK